MTRIGAVFSPYQNTPEDLYGAVRAAEASGVPELWLWEDCFRESAFAPVAAALAWTTNLRIGMGISPMPLRNVAVTAMEIATIDRLFPGRFYPGVGHGVLPWMAQAGARVASPLTLMREYVPALRALLAGQEVTVQGRYVNLDQVQLERPPAIAPPVYAAGQGPKTLALSGEVADGAIFVAGLTAQEVGAQSRLVHAGSANAARKDAPVIIAYVTAAFGPDAQQRVNAEPRGNAFENDRALWGTPSEVALGVKQFANAGADAVILVPADGEPDFTAFLGGVGEVAQLLG